tara:strand:- start:251 stop:1441 length:1191 start_codon:yes stop_codon:yes gene_type:complete
LEKKFLFIIFSIVLVSISPQVFANDELDALLVEKNGVLIEQQKIIFEVGKYTNIQVKHVIETGAWSMDRPRIIEIIPGEHSNPTVTDEDGDKLNFAYEKDTFEESKYIILNQKLGNYDLIVEYTLDNFMELKDGLWTKELKFGEEIVVMIDEEIEIIFANSRPVDVSNAKGINCIGCNMNLEYFDMEKFSSKEILFDNEKFAVDFLTNGKISDMEFIGGGSQLLNFDVKEKNQLYVVKIPLELMLNPYEVYFTEKDDTNLDQIDKIRKTEFSQDNTHVNLSFRTVGEGTVSIVGSTQEEHQQKLEQLENIKSREVKSEAIEKEKGVALPIPGTKAASELALQSSQMDEEEMDELSFAGELNNQTSNSEDNTTTIAIISGIVIAGIVGGIILKLKKN